MDAISSIEVTTPCHLQHVGGLNLNHPFFQPLRRRTAKFASFSQIAGMARPAVPGVAVVVFGSSVRMFNFKPSRRIAAEVARLIVLLRV